MRAKKLFTYFLPFVANSILRVVAIPITTQVLGPAEYGLFALMMGVVSICAVLASGTTAYVISHRIVPGEIAPRGLIATLVLQEVVVSLVLGTICAVAWPWFARWIGISGNISSGWFPLLLLSVPLSAFWSSGNMVLVLDQRAWLYSATIIAQGALQLLTTIVALYVFDLRLGALIISQVVGAATYAVGGYLGLRRHFSAHVDRNVVRESLFLMPWSMISGFTNSATALLERIVLGRVTSTYQLGLYVHSQTYRVMFDSVGAAFAQVLQPAMLREARAEHADFSETREGWNVVFAMFTSIGVLFALMGGEIIGALTHGKFTPAAIYVPFWCVVLILQYLGRPQVAMLYANGQGKKISSALLVSNIVAGVLMLALGIPLGAPGLVAAVLFGELVNRALLQFWTYRLWSIGFQDGQALLGALLVIGITFAVHLFAPGLAVRITIFAAFTLIMLVVIGPRAWKFVFGEVVRLGS